MADELLRAGLAARFLRGPITPERIRKLLRLAKRGSREDFAATLAAIPDPAVRAQVETAAVTVTFRG